MVIGLGVDLTEIERVAESLERWGTRLIGKLMDPEEACRLPPGGREQKLALAQAIVLKEAASKAIGTGWSRGVRWRDVIVESRAPASIRLVNRAAEVARALGAREARTHAHVEHRGDLVIGEVWLLR